MKYGLVAIDIDGTLLDSQGLIRHRVREAIWEATERGCKIVLATGRRYRSARKVWEDLGVKLPLVMYTGALVYDPVNEKALLHKPLPPFFIEQAVKVVLEAGLQPIILQSPLSGEHIFLGPAEYDSDFFRSFATRPDRVPLTIRCPYAEMSNIKDGLTVSTIGPSSAIEALKKVVADRFECNIYGYRLHNPNFVDFSGFDVVQPSVNKGLALQWLAEYYGLAISQTMAIGDNFNDLDMLRMAGLGVAMGNAAAEVKAAANVTVSTNNEEGVAEALERYLLNA